VAAVVVDGGAEITETGEVTATVGIGHGSLEVVVVVAVVV